MHGEFAQRLVEHGIRKMAGDAAPSNIARYRSMLEGLVADRKASVDLSRRTRIPETFDLFKDVPGLGGKVNIPIPFTNIRNSMYPAGHPWHPDTERQALASAENRLASLGLLEKTLAAKQAK